MYSSQQSQYHTQTNACQSQQELNNDCSRLRYKRGRSTEDETERETRHTKEIVYWLNQTSNSNPKTVLQDEESEDQKLKSVLRTLQNIPTIYITDFKKYLTTPTAGRSNIKTAIRDSSSRRQSG
jgi:hypothetical protein